MVSRVFIPQAPQTKDKTTGKYRPKLDLSPAHAFGELVELLAPSATPFQTEDVIEALNEQLEVYTDNDYILCVGNPIIIGWTTAIAASYNDGRVKMLQWNGVTGGYEVVEAELWSVM